MSDEIEERLGPALGWAEMQRIEWDRIFRDARFLAGFSKRLGAPIITWAPLRDTPRAVRAFLRLYRNEN